MRVPTFKQMLSLHVPAPPKLPLPGSTQGTNRRGLSEAASNLKEKKPSARNS
eukprot:CAMPEP_0204167144 /NCGR_PEP_ID=MMETSP0361-20130328/39612_1 /ASSEMBLY_ACC=CAM_ASM_000343 /TAXON_ID=268821 /ORGANISM="Scrippsiella Hangoei, Strain SHTV-5" /LENGTH=51 /DNA_ID=CAMNT_0051124403 /DNA_START=174 /DNA_END=326 /DNA_ORIENTATION=+